MFQKEMEIRLALKSSLDPVLCCYITSAVVRISGLRLRRLVSEKESLSNQDILSLSIKCPQWAQNVMEAPPEGAAMTCRGTQACPHLPEASIVCVVCSVLFAFKGQSVHLSDVLCRNTSLYPGVERKAGYGDSFQMAPHLPDVDLV